MAQKTFNNTKINVDFEETASRQQLNSGENISTLFGKIKKFFSDLKTIAFSGSYKDLSDTPTIPSVGNGTITITQNGVEKGKFSVNQSDNKTIELPNEIASNPNILINPDFQINQRGQTEYTTSGYTFDGWSINVGNVSKNDAGGVIINNTASSAMRYRQYIELDFAQLLGKIITLSVCVDGVVYSATGDVPTEEPTAQTNILQIVVSASLSVNLNYLPAKKAFDLYFYVVSGTSLELSWAKLELGGNATPYCPPDPAMELIKCQRYYQIRSTGDIAAVDMRPSMRTITDIKQRSDGTYEYIAEL